MNDSEKELSSSTLCPISPSTVKAFTDFEFKDYVPVPERNIQFDK